MEGVFIPYFRLISFPFPAHPLEGSFVTEQAETGQMPSIGKATKLQKEEKVLRAGT
jgi:hypothetical protein